MEPVKPATSDFLFHLSVTTVPLGFATFAAMPPRITHKQRQLRRTFIREWRESRGLSQDQLVERVRENVDTFSKSTLSRLENGLQAYTQPMLEAIADALGGGLEPQDLLMRHPGSGMWSIVDQLKGMGTAEQEQVARIIAAIRKVS